MKRWTPRLAVSVTKRNIARAVERLRAISIEWSDVDDGYVRDAEDLIRVLNAFAERVETEIAERIAAGEHIGV
jgi:hypothetical protein